MYNSRTSDYLIRKESAKPLKLDMHPLLSGETNVLTFAYDFPIVEALAENGMEDCLLFTDVSFSGPAHVAGRVENLAGYMRMIADVGVSYDTLCARCAKTLCRTIDFGLERDVADTAGDFRLTDPDNDDYVLIVDGKLNLDEPVLDQLFLEFPMKHLCDEDCRGLCPVCGKDLNEGDCGCETGTVDPRFAALKQLLDNGAFSDESDDSDGKDEE